VQVEVFPVEQQILLDDQLGLHRNGGCNVGRHAPVNASVRAPHAGQRKVAAGHRHPWVEQALTVRL